LELMSKVEVAEKIVNFTEDLLNEKADFIS